MKTRIEFSVAKISTKRQNYRKIILTDIAVNVTRDAITPSVRNEAVKLLKEQKRLTALKKQRKATGAYSPERKELNRRIKTKTTNINKRFNKLIGLNKDGSQSELGKQILPLDKDGLYKTEIKRRVKYDDNGVKMGSILTYEDFADNIGKIFNILSDYGVLDFMYEFVGESSSEWIRRVMNKCGVDSSVSINTFIKWLIKAGIGR